MFCERVRCDTGYSGLDWSPMVILGGRMGGAVGVSTLGGWAKVCTGSGGGDVAGGLLAITLGAAGVHPWSRLGVLLRHGIWRNRRRGNRQEDGADAGEGF